MNVIHQGVPMPPNPFEFTIRYPVEAPQPVSGDVAFLNVDPSHGRWRIPNGWTMYNDYTATRRLSPIDVVDLTIKFQTEFEGVRHPALTVVRPLYQTGESDARIHSPSD